MFKTGNEYGKLSKRGKSIDKEMKDKIKDLSNRLIESIDIEELTPNQRIALLKAVMEFESFYNGTLSEIVVQEGEFSESGKLICILTEIN